MPLYHSKQSRSIWILQCLKNGLLLGLTILYLWTAWQFAYPVFWETTTLAVIGVTLAVATKIGSFWRSNHILSFQVVRLDPTLLFFYIYTFSVSSLTLQIQSTSNWPLDAIPDFSLFYGVILTLSLFLLTLLYTGNSRRTLLLGVGLQLVFTSWLYIYWQGQYGRLLMGMYAVLIVIWLMSWIKQEQKIYRTPFDYPIIFFIGVGLLSTWQAAYVNDSLLQFLGFAGEILMAYILISSIITRLELILLSVVIAFMGGGIFSLPFLIKFILLWHNLGIETALHYRYTLGSIHPNRIGPLLAATIFLTAGLVLVNNKKIWRGVLLIFLLLQVVTLLFTYSLAGWIGFSAGLITFAGFIWIKRSHDIFTHKPSKRLASWSACLIGLVLLSVVPFSNIIMQKAQKVFVAGPLQQRLTLWNVAFKNIGEHPITGVGLGNYYTRLQYAPESLNIDFSHSISLPGGLILPASSVGVYIDNIDAWVDQQNSIFNFHPHNLYLFLAEGMGLPGLVAYIWLLISLCWWILYFWRTYDDYQTALVAGSFAGLLTVFAGGWTDIPASYNFWLLLGLIVIASSLGKDNNLLPSYSTEEVLISNPSLAGGSQPGVWLNRFYGRFLRNGVFSLFIALLFIFSLVFSVSAPFIKWYDQQSDGSVRNRNLKQAVTELKKAQVLAPLNADLRAKMGNLYRALGQTEPALTEYQQAADLKKEFAPLYTQIGQLYLCSGQLDPAVQAFKTALQLDPWGTLGREHYSDLAIAYALSGEREKSIQMFQQAFNLEPEAVNRSYWQTDYESDSTRLRLRDSNYCSPEENAFYRQVEANIPDININDILDPLYEEARYMEATVAEKKLIYLGESYLKLEQYQKALEIFETLKEQHGTGVYDFKLGMIYADMDNLSQAEKFFNIALPLMKGNPVLHYELGDLYARQGRYEEAEIELNKAIALFPHTGYQDAYLKLIDVYLEQEKTDKAITVLRQEIFLRNSDTVRRQLASTLQYVGAYREATEEYRQIVLGAAKLDTPMANDWRLSVPMQAIEQLFEIQGFSQKQSMREGEDLLGKYHRTFNGHIAMGNFYLAVARGNNE